MATDTALHSFSSFEDAKNIVINYINKYLSHYDLGIVLENEEMTIWGNEYFEFKLFDKNGNGFFEIHNIEIHENLDACFYVPMILSDFAKVMKIVNP